MSWQVEDAVFVGDTLFMPDYGTARCDFPGGSADQLYDSIRRTYALPDSTRLFMCHDYQPGGRELRFLSSVAEQKQSNVQLRQGTMKQEYVKLRTAPDAKLDMPALILPCHPDQYPRGGVSGTRGKRDGLFKNPVERFLRKLSQEISSMFERESYNPQNSNSEQEG